MIDIPRITTDQWAELRQIERGNVEAEINQALGRLNQLLGRAHDIGLIMYKTQVYLQPKPGRPAMRSLHVDQTFE